MSQLLSVGSYGYDINGHGLAQVQIMLAHGACVGAGHRVCSVVGKRGEALSSERHHHGSQYTVPASLAVCTIS